MRALPASVLAVCGLIASACGGTGTGGAASGQAAPATSVEQTAAEQTPARQSPTGQSPAKQSPPDAKPLEGKVVVIDPGHNGGNYRDPKAINRQVNVLTKWKACDTTGTETNNGYTEA